MKFITIILGGLFIVLSLSGCGPAGPESQAAHLLKQQMKSPDSFVEKESKIMWQGKDKDGNNAYVVKVTYTAQNSFGANLQDCKMVAFAIVGDKLSYNQRMGFEMCGKEGDPLFDPKQIAKFMSSQFEE